MSDDLHIDPSDASPVYPDLPPSDAKITSTQKQEYLRIFAWEFLRRDPNFISDYEKHAALMKSADMHLVANDRDLFAKHYRCFVSDEPTTEKRPSDLAAAKTHPLLKNLPKSALKNFRVTQSTDPETPSRPWRLEPALGGRKREFGRISNADRKKHWKNAIASMERRRIFPPDYMGLAEHEKKSYTICAIRDELGHKYAIKSDPGDYHPSQPTPPQFEVDIYPFEPTSSPLEIDSTSEIALVFSLSIDARAQTVLAKKYLLAAAKAQRIPNFRAQMKQYIFYLKLLDAKERGADTKELLNMLSTNGKLDKTRSNLSENLKTARALRDGDYIRLVGGRFSPPLDH